MCTKKDREAWGYGKKPHLQPCWNRERWGYCVNVRTMDLSFFIEVNPLSLEGLLNFSKSPKPWVLLALAAPPGFEPGSTEPKSVVLPLHHGAMFAIL